MSSNVPIPEEYKYVYAEAAQGKPVTMIDGEAEKMSNRAMNAHHADKNYSSLTHRGRTRARPGESQC